jgi:hypothetical protein
MYADTPLEFFSICFSSSPIKGNERTLVFSSGSPIHALGSELILDSDDGSGIEMLTGGIERDRDVVGRRPEAAILGP